MDAPTLRQRLYSILKNSALVFYLWYTYQTFFKNTASPQGLGEDLEEPLEHFAEARAAFSSLQTRIQEVCGKSVPVVFLYIPYSYVVRPADLPRWQHLHHHDPKQHLRRTRSIQRERMYYYVDIHLTPAGNRVVAQEVARLIERILMSHSDTRKIDKVGKGVLSYAKV